MYTIFRDKGLEYYIVSKNSIEYTDFLKMKESGHMTEVMNGTRKECLEFIDEKEAEVIQ